MELRKLTRILQEHDVINERPLTKEKKKKISVEKKVVCGSADIYLLGLG